MKRNFTCLKRVLLIAALLMGCTLAYAQPANDNCNNAIAIDIGNNGFDTGIFSSDTVNMGLATMQAGETVPPAILVAGQNQKSVWYKFHTGTRRSLRVTLKQPGIVIAAGDVGFSVYKANTCLPGTPQLSTKLTPIETFGNSFHPCVDSGDYYIQVSSKSNVSGLIFIELEVAPAFAVYDEMDSAYQFGVLSPSMEIVQYDVACHSKEGVFESCSLLSANYDKTSWHTFTTPGYFDFISLLISGNGYYTNGSVTHTIGFALYEGDARTQGFDDLIPIVACDTFMGNGYYAGHRTFLCDILNTNTTYSVQLFFKDSFESNIRLGIITEGTAPSKAPRPILSQMDADNQLGQLPFGTTNRVDYFGCNARHENNPCGATVPGEGIIRGNVNYNLSTFYTFSVDQSVNIQINADITSTDQGCSDRLVRVFSDGVSNDCNSIDTSELYDEFYNSKWLNCLPPGNYTVQVMGSDMLRYNSGYFYYWLVGNSAAPSCWRRNLGQQINMRFVVNNVQQHNRFSLFEEDAYEPVNSLQALSMGTFYQSDKDTFGCNSSVLPAMNECAANYTKAMYREFVVDDSAAIRISKTSVQYLQPNFYDVNMRYALFRGDANALAAAQNAWAYPNTIDGLEPLTPCFRYSDFHSYYDSVDVCVEPGTYTLVTLGTDAMVGWVDSASVYLKNYVTNHHSPATAQNMGSIVDSIGNAAGGSRTSDLDYFSCKNNADTINGFSPCNGATKAIYREFYLSQPAFVTITRTSYYYNNGVLALFSGQVSDVGPGGLTNIWPCFTNKSTEPCQALPAGWYTVVSYANGSSYEQPNYNNDVTGGDVGQEDRFTISVSYECQGPQFNRPYKAAIDNITNLPFRIEWDAAAAGAYPVSGVDYTLPTEHFNCTIDTPFSTHPITACVNNQNRVAYYVFEITQPGYLVAYSNLYTKIYPADVRVDSAAFDTMLPLQECMSNEGKIEICNIRPGIYTLVIFAGVGQVCGSVTPKLYIDKVGHSRFDHASNAYDFGIVPPDNIYHDGKAGDVNPLHPLRAASNDFFYCTTGAQQTDPAGGLCYVTYNENIYNQPDTDVVLFPEHTGAINIPRRNLWYTFQVDKPGWVSVKVDNKTPNRDDQYRFAIYGTNADGTIDFEDLVTNGAVDSTYLQGLTDITNNGLPTVYCDGTNTVSFFIEPCNFQTKRYYVVVDNRNPGWFGYPTGNMNMRPNHQVEVSVKIDSVSVPPTLHDYYSNAGDIGVIGLGSNYFGDEDNYTCATYTPPYPSGLPACSDKTLWYKFTVNDNVTGTLRIRLWLDSMVYTALYEYEHLRLYKEIVPGDSTPSGLLEIPTSYVYNGGSYWRNSCISEGNYYLLLTGCNRIDEKVFPELVIDESAGDYCGAPLVADIEGPGSASVTLNVDCHTIGTDYGEFSPTLTCPPNGETEDYKTSWFRIDVTGNDTLDITTYITETTNATSAQIRYRMMTGTCDAMQEQSCVLDAQTQNTYECMIPGNSYYIQVFVPKLYNDYNATTGNITLNLSAIEHQGECSPLNNCLANANFMPYFDCNENDSAIFFNYSTFGNSIQYFWDFGYNGAISNAVSPRFRYPALSTSATYTVELMVVNTSCFDTVYATQTITIPPRPEAALGSDTLICNGSDSLLLDATSFTGSTYLWSNNAVTPTQWASAAGTNEYKVAITYAGCTVHDSIEVYISPVIPQPPASIYTCGPDDTIALDAYRNINGVTYVWSNGATDSAILINTAGTYIAAVSLNGCVVTDTFNVSATNNDIDVLGNDTAVCITSQGFQLDADTTGATSYLWQDGSTGPQYMVMTTGTYWVQLQLGGCTYSDTVNITAAPSVTYHAYDTICFGAAYTLPGNITVDEEGVYYDTLQTTNGCDSVIITHLQVRDSAGVNIYNTVCVEELPVAWNNITINAGGATVFNTTDLFGCDSTVTLYLTVLPADSVPVHDTVCANDLPYIFNGQNIAAQGISYHNFDNVSGCDSVVILNLVVLPVSQSSIYDTVCSNDLPYDFNGIDINAAGIYSDTLMSAAGCDSIITLQLNVLPLSYDTLFAEICEGAIYSYAGNSFSQTGNYSFTYNGQNGCDSILTLSLLVKPLPDPPLVNSPVTYCPDETAVPLSATGSNLLWYTTATGGIGTSVAPVPGTSVIGTTVYYVSQTADACEGPRDSVIVYVREKPVAAFTILPVEACALEPFTVTFTGTAPVASEFHWNWDGAGISGNNPGPYTLTWEEAGNKIITLWIDNLGCASDTVIRAVIVNPVPDPPFINMQEYACIYDMVVITCESASQNVLYDWNIDGERIPGGYIINKSWDIAGDKVVSLNVTENGCTSVTVYDTISIIPLPDASIRSDDNSDICQNATITLTAAAGEGYTYLWSPDYYFRETFNNTQSVTPRIVMPGAIYLNVTDRYGCTNSDSVLLETVHCCTVLIPNAFSPNGDGINDRFGMVTLAAQEVNRLAVYNRWGECVFVSFKAEDTWDGTYKGKPADVGTYHFYLQYTCSNGEVFIMKGDVSLLR